MDPYTYTLQNGNTQALADPLSLDGAVIDNDFQTFMANIMGYGDELTFTLSATSNGGSKVLVFDNIAVRRRFNKLRTIRDQHAMNCWMALNMVAPRINPL